LKNGRNSIQDNGGRVPRKKEDKMDVEIKNCPFCNSKAELIGMDNKYDIRCTNLNCFLAEGGGWYCKSGEVIDKWNYRK